MEQITQGRLTEEVIQQDDVSEDSESSGSESDSEVDKELTAAVTQAARDVCAQMELEGDSDDSEAAGSEISDSDDPNSNNIFCLDPKPTATEDKNGEENETGEECSNEKRQTRPGDNGCNESDSAQQNVHKESHTTKKGKQNKR